MAREDRAKEKRQLLISVLLALAALVSITAATVAWFTIADFTKVHSMSMEITSGTNLRFDLDAHEQFEEYCKVLSFSQIADRIQRDLGYDMRKVPLEPVTTEDFQIFTFENGTVAEPSDGAYLEFTLHFMAAEDMLIHLTSQDSGNGRDGTVVQSTNAGLPKAMRISFSVDGQELVYHPGMGDTNTTEGNVKYFGLPDGERMQPNENNQMFWVKKNVDCPVVVHVWLEGTDPVCTDELRNADYRIRLRFVGTDKEHHILTGDGR